MMVDTFLAAIVARRLWGWNKYIVLLLGVIFFAIDAAFLGANMLKISSGGWFPLLVGFVILMLMMTWRKGRKVLHEKLHENTMPLVPFIDSLMQDKPTKVPGTAVFMTSTTDIVPHAFLHNLKHNKVVHSRVIILTVITDEVPYVPQSDRLVVEKLNWNFYIIRAHYGFKESPDVPLLLQSCSSEGLQFNMMDTSFFLGKERMVAGENSTMPAVTHSLFALMNRNAMTATDFFNIPANRVVELGTQIEL